MITFPTCSSRWLEPYSPPVPPRYVTQPNRGSSHEDRCYESKRKRVASFGNVVQASTLLGNNVVTPF
jgi:hypothetical protein